MSDRSRRKVESHPPDRINATCPSPACLTPAPGAVAMTTLLRALPPAILLSPPGSAGVQATSAGAAYPSPRREEVVVEPDDDEGRGMVGTQRGVYARPA